MNRGNVAVGVLLALAVAAGTVIAIVAFIANSGFEGVAELAAATESSDSSSSDGPLPAPEPLVVNQPVQDALNAFAPRRLYQFTLDQPRTVVMTLDGEFDTFLELHLVQTDGSTLFLEEDDDGGDGLNSRISTSLPAGTYAALVRPYSRGDIGPFTFQVTLR